MKKLKITAISLLSIFIILYLAFLFILPNAVDLNEYTPEITKNIQDSVGFQVHLKGLKIKTAWNLSVGAAIDKVDLDYPTGKKFAQINNLQVRLSLLPLILKQIRLDKVEMSKIMLNLDVKENSKFLLEDYLPKATTPQKQAFKLSDKMPDISIDNYRLSFVDMKTLKSYSIKGSDLKISNFILNKKIKVKTNGNLFLNDRKQVGYKISLFSKVFAQPQQQQASPQLNIIQIFENLYRYNLQANIETDLKITGSVENTKMDGKVKIDNLSFVIGNEIFPASNLDLVFSGDKIKIDSTLYANTNSKILATGWVKNGKKKAVDLKVVSNQIDLHNVVLVLDSILKTFGKKDLDGITAGGYLQADFDVKSDFKKIQSNGYLKVKNASIVSKLYNVVLNSINADVDFSHDAIRIKQASASVNGQPIKAKGVIDKNANADITVSADNVQLKGILLASGNAKLLKDNDIQGLLNMKAYIKGRLDKIAPVANINISNINVKNKPSKMLIKLAKVTVDANAGKKVTGKIKLSDLKAYQGGSVLASSPFINLDFNEKDLNIHKSNLYVSGIRTNLEGKISDISSVPKLNSVIVSTANQVSMPIEGFPNSSIILKGNIVLNGNPENPQIKGGFSVPLIKIPSMQLLIRNTELTLGKEFKIACPYIKIANSFMSFNSLISKDFSKGLVLKNADFSSQYLDLDTISAAMSKVPQGSGDLGIIIQNGKVSVARFKTGGITASNITSTMSLKHNVLYLDNINADAYNGKIKGSINYNVLNGKTGMNVQGRGLSANPALIAISGRNDHIVGVLDFDSNITMKGATEKEILNSLKGDTNFIITNGQMGVLGKLEYLIAAQNVVANNVFRSTLNVITKGLSLKNTGVYRYLKGKIYLSNGWANINWIKMSGPSMSLYISGRYYLPGSTAHLTILGRIPQEIVNMLGPIGEFSVNKAIMSIPKIGIITSIFLDQFTTNPNYENIDLIPELTPKTEFATKEFKVVIDGDIQKQRSVKSFKWLSKPTAAQAQTQSKTVINGNTIKEQYQNTVKQTQDTVKGYQNNIKQQYEDVKKQIPTSIPDFVNKLPNLQ